MEFFVGPGEFFTPRQLNRWSFRVVRRIIHALRFRSSNLYLLLALTIFGGALRFAYLERPAIWGDESQTLGRVCGSYQDLLDRLQYDGFGPMHYEAYWWIANGFPYKFETKSEPVRPIALPQRRRLPQKEPTSQPTEKKWLYPTKSLTAPVKMTPFVMRFIPALAGTLMIPAMYFLAVQLTNRRVAMIAATFTACSAYLLVYSRDAKMYMHLWLFCTLSMGCMLWWFRCARVEFGGQPGQRPYRRIAWLGWLASSIAMVGIHATGAVILGLEVAFVLMVLLVQGVTSVRSRWSLLHFGLGAASGLAVLCIAAAGILVHHFAFAKYLERVEENPWESGIGWVRDYNRDRAGPDLIKFAASAFTMSWEWPTQEMVDNIPIRTFRTMALSCYGLLLIAMVALFPWRQWRWSKRLAGPKVVTVVDAAKSEDHFVFVAPGTPSRVLDYHSGVPRFPAIQLPIATLIRRIAVLFLFVWLIVPAYAMYCRSIIGFFSPAQIFTSITAIAKSEFSALSLAWKIAVLAVPVVGIVWSAISSRTLRKWLLSIGLVVLTVVILLAICQVTYLVMGWRYSQAMKNGKPWDSIWMPRYVGYLWPAFAILAALLIARLPTRPIRGIVILALVGINLLNFSWRVIESEPPTAQMAFEVLASQGETATTRAYTQVRHGFGAPPGMGGVQSFAWRYYMMVYGNLKGNPLQLGMMGAGIDDSRIFVRQNVSPQYISNDLKKSPQLTRIIVWDKINAGWADVNTEDRVRKALGSSWRFVGEKKYTAWDHWTWQELFTARRREYVRNQITNAPATQRVEKVAAQ